MPSIPEYLAQAIASHRAGHLPDAVDAYRRVLQLDPGNAHASYLLGGVYEALGRLDEAAESFRQALRLRPDYAEAHNHYGVVLARQGKFQAAAESFQCALRIKPDFVDARNNLSKALACGGGNVVTNDSVPTASAPQGDPRQMQAAEWHYQRANSLRQQGRADEAIAAYRQAVELKPDFATAHNSLGIALVRQGNVAAAITSFQNAIRVNPVFATAHVNLGTALREAGRFDEALRCYYESLRLDPNAAIAHSNLGDALRQQGKLDEAAAHCRRAIEIEPNFADAHGNLGATLYDQGRLVEAAVSYQQAVRWDPNHVTAYDSMGKTLQLLGRLDEAKQCYHRLLQINPHRKWYELRLASMCPTVFGSNAEIDQYRDQLLRELRRFATLDLRIHTAEVSELGCEPPFNLQFHGRNDRALRQAYADVFRRVLPPLADAPAPRTGKPRIGFLLTMAKEWLFLRSLRGVIERLSPKLFERVVICPSPTAAMIRQGLGGASVEVLGLPGRFDLAAQTIRDAQFDLLYFWEVSTDSTNYFLPYLRLAPVQCTSWGIQLTSGIPAMDYYVSSALVESEDAAEHYTEQLVLANTLLTYQQRVSAPVPGKTRADFGLPADRHLYLCPQQLGKFHPDFDPLLADILRRDPKGLIVITADRYGSLTPLLRRRFAAAMPDVVDRVVFVPHQATADYLGLIAVGDVLLDPLHFGGVNTTYDGLSLNQPIVTLPSQFQRGRYTLGCYKKMGLADCIAADKQQYVEMAVALGTDAAYRAEVVQRIREASPVLFEDIESVREHERIFAELIERSRSAHGVGD